jgi:hypothetical protein
VLSPKEQITHFANRKIILKTVLRERTGYIKVIIHWCDESTTWETGMHIRIIHLQTICNITPAHNTSFTFNPRAACNSSSWLRIGSNGAIKNPVELKPDIRESGEEYWADSWFGLMVQRIIPVKGKLSLCLKCLTGRYILFLRGTIATCFNKLDKLFADVLRLT